MKTNHLTYIIIALALLLTIGLTLRDVAATTAVVSGYASSEITCASLPFRYSIHNKHIEETGLPVTYTEDGPTGIDGGLIYLLSSYRTCSP
jgi:hypothetical protein